VKILIVSATLAEINPLCQFLDIEAIKIKDYHYSFFDGDIYFLIAGPGIMCMTFSLSMYCSINKIDFAINAGIAGSFDPSCILGSVFNVKKDRIADLGAEFPDGSFQDIFEMNLLDKNIFPYDDGWLYADVHPDVPIDLPEATGVTVNMVSGNIETIEKIKLKYHPNLESMEGSAFLYVCKSLNIRCLQIRSVSNHVEPRNKENWKIQEAIKNLNLTLIRLLKNLKEYI
jgi:futalosine hydrolase